MFTALEASYGGCTGLCITALGARKAEPSPRLKRKKETSCFINCDVFGVPYSSLFGKNNPYLIPSFLPMARQLYTFLLLTGSLVAGSSHVYAGWKAYRV